MTCNGMIDNSALVSTLAYVKQKIHSTSASQGAGHFPKEQYGHVPYDTIQYHYTCFGML